MYSFTVSLKTISRGTAVSEDTIVISDLQNYDSEDIEQLKEDYLCEIAGSRSENRYDNRRVELADSDVPSCEPRYKTGAVHRSGWEYAPPALKWEEWKREAKSWDKRIDKMTLWEWLQDDLTDTPEPFRSNLHKFIVNLYAYDDTVRGPMTWREIFSLSMNNGPAFARDLDQYRAACIGAVTNSGYLDPELATIFQVYSKPALDSETFRLDSLYRPNMLMNWVAPVLDIRTVSFTPVDINPDTLSEFRDAIRQVLSNPRLDFFQETNWKNVESDNTKSCVGGKNFEMERQEPASIRGISELVNVPRELKEQRCASKEEYSSALRIKWIEQNVQRILSVDPRSKMKLSARSLRYELAGAIKPGRFARAIKEGEAPPALPWTYCRDFKKEGLTKPRVLLRVMLEELNRRFPQAQVFKSTDFFDEWKPVDKNGVVYETTRGHGLGMASALTTLMQLGIEEINNKRIHGTPHFSAYYNDDAAVIMYNREKLERYVLTDQEVCKELGLEFKKKATFVAQGYVVLCEQHVCAGSPGFSRKDAYYRQEFYNLFCCVNAAHARELSRSMNCRGIPARDLQRVMEYWGWVLFRNEHRLSSWEGGWWRKVEEGVDTSFFRRCDDLLLSKETVAALSAYKTVTRQVIPWSFKRKKQRWYEKKTTIDYDMEFLELVGDAKWQHESETFRPSMNGSEETRSWRSYQKILRKVWSRELKNAEPISLRDLYLQTHEASKMDILPTEGLCETIDVRMTLCDKPIEFHNPYSSLGRQLDYEVYKETRGCNKYSARCNPKNLITVGIKNTATEYFHEGPWMSTSGDSKARYKEYIEPTDEIVTQWHNPWAVTTVTDRWFPYKCVSLKNKAGRAPSLDDRWRVYGRELTAAEWRQLGTVAPTDRLLLLSAWDVAPDDLADFCKDLRKYPGLGRLIPFERTDIRFSTLPKMWARWIRLVDQSRESISHFVEETIEELPELSNAQPWDGGNPFFVTDYQAPASEWEHEHEDYQIDRGPVEEVTDSMVELDYVGAVEYDTGYMGFPTDWGADDLSSELNLTWT